MKRSLLAVGMVAAMLLSASSAFAGGVSLAWQNCAALSGATNRTFACGSNTGSNPMALTFQLDADLGSVSGTEGVMDLISQTTPLPAWWELKFVGSCRTSSLLNATAYNGDASAICLDWAQGQATPAVASYTINGQNPGLGVNTARVKLISAVPNTALQDLLANTEYGAYTITINNQKSIGTGSCAGCNIPVCIVLNSINVTTDQNLNNTFLGTGITPGSNIITWQGAGADCQAVPVKNTTWGQVKALYR